MTVHLNVAIVCEREVKRKFIAGVLVTEQDSNRDDKLRKISVSRVDLEPDNPIAEYLRYRQSNGSSILIEDTKEEDPAECSHYGGGRII